MSVIAVKVYKDKIVIGADSIRVRGYTQEKDKTAKLYEVNNMVVGHVGASRNAQFMYVFAKNHNPAAPTLEAVIDFVVEYIDWCKKRDSNYKLESNFLLVFKGKVFCIMQDMFIQEVKDYAADGAGKDYALAALYLGKNVEDAITVATELSIYCEAPVNIIEKKRA